MELYQLRYFLAVCEELNFTRAAARCSVTQPTLTRGIKKLEDELGGPLFRRERNLTHLTDLGRLMKPHLEQSLAGAEAAKDKARGFLDLEDAPLSLGIMCTVGPAQMIGLIAALSRAAPGIDLSIHETTPDDLVERLWKGEIDVALLAQPEELPERFDVATLYRERFVVAFPPGHRFEQLNAVSLADLDGETYLERTKCEYAGHIGTLLEERGVTLRLGYRSEREEWVQAMILAGLGITLIPEYLPMFPGLSTRVVADPPVTRAIKLVTVAGRRFSPAVREFVRLSRSYDWPESA
jgi:DNA-binding transcriptional LysR family regulator